MTKAEMLKLINSNGLQHTCSGEIWKLVFKEYHKQTGQKMSFGCGSCCAKIYKWLQND